MGGGAAEGVIGIAHVACALMRMRTPFPTSGHTSPSLDVGQHVNYHYRICPLARNGVD